MNFLVNDLSFHGQFLDIASFRGAVQRLMTIRQITRRFGRTLHCNRNLLHAQVTVDKNMQHAVQTLSREERSALMQWLTQHGPFWDEVRHHRPDDWMESNSEVVTDTAVGEAAWCCLNGIERGIVSITPSNWLFSPVPVVWVTATTVKKSVDVMNYWDPMAIEDFLQTMPVPLASWADLEVLVTTRCTNLTFAVDAFLPLRGYAFALGAAQRLRFVLDVLNRFKSCFDANGQRTPEGHQIYQDFFTGKKGDGGHGALFTDSSDNEKNAFKTEMTFKHPADSTKTLFCPWHGKVQTPQLRVHFSWPIRADEPLFVVYVGPKITKR